MMTRHEIIDYVVKTSVNTDKESLRQELETLSWYDLKETFHLFVSIDKELNRSKFNSTPELDKDELAQAMLKTGQYQRKEMQRAAASIRRKLRKRKT